MKKLLDKINEEDESSDTKLEKFEYQLSSLLSQHKIKNEAFKA
jgi:hypothetical protein